MHDYILSLTPYSFSRVITRIVVLILRARETCKKVVKKNLSSVHKVKPPEVIEIFYNTDTAYKCQARIHGFWQEITC